MEELVEVLRQWHMESSISQIKRSMGMSRKTTRKYIKLAQSCGFSRNVEIQHYQYYLELADRIQKELTWYYAWVPCAGIFPPIRPSLWPVLLRRAWPVHLAWPALPWPP